jgi:hypothetical protein
VQSKGEISPPSYHVVTFTSIYLLPNPLPTIISPLLRLYQCFWGYTNFGVIPVFEQLCFCDNLQCRALPTWDIEDTTISIIDQKPWCITSIYVAKSIIRPATNPRHPNFHLKIYVNWKITNNILFASLMIDDALIKTFLIFYFFIFLFKYSYYSYLLIPMY